jgi:TonB family protein
MACRSLLPFFAPLVGAFLIGASIVALLATSTRVFPSSESEQPDPIASNSVRFSVHAKSRSAPKESAELNPAGSSHPSQPSSPSYVASIAQQSHSLEEVISGFDKEPAPVSHPRPSTNPSSTVTRCCEAQQKKIITGSDPELGPRPTIVSSAAKRSPSSPRSSPRQDATSYGARVRSVLARQPRAVGPAGTATVMFAIGRSGDLRYARISDTSYNTALDAMALATVENAAPFPRPPKALSPEALSYSIQIGFRER